MAGHDFPEIFSYVLNQQGPTEPSQLLNIAAEPSLQRDASTEFEAYRFNHIGERVFPCHLIRIERDEGDCRLVAKVCDAPRAYRGPWKVHVDRLLSPLEFDEIADLLDRAGFWNTAYSVPEECNTGWTAISIAGRKLGRYHAIERLMGLPDSLDKIFRRACRLAGIDD
jgi:hypothetical protein